MSVASATESRAPADENVLDIRLVAGEASLSPQITIVVMVLAGLLFGFLNPAGATELKVTGSHTSAKLTI